MGKNNLQKESARLNNLTYAQYIQRLTELSVSMFEWRNLPDTVDERYIEMSLLYTGSALFFWDEVIGYLCLNMLSHGNFDCYGNPVTRRAYSKYNNYNRELTNKDSVIIWNNYTRTNSILDIRMFSKRLYNLDRIIDVNANAQKTPVLVLSDEKQRLVLQNLYMQYDGNMPFIFGDKNLDISGIKVLSTQAPYVADKIFDLKSRIWNEALTYLGISSLNIQKKERLITDEVTRNQGAVIASRYNRLEARRKAANEINRMFGLNIEVYYREDTAPEQTTNIGDKNIEEEGEGDE